MYATQQVSTWQPFKRTCNGIQISLLFCQMSKFLPPHHFLRSFLSLPFLELKAYCACVRRTIALQVAESQCHMLQRLQKCWQSLNVAKSRTQFYFRSLRCQPLTLHVTQGNHCLATCVPMALRDKLQKKLPRVTLPIKVMRDRITTSLDNTRRSDQPSRRLTLQKVELC